MLRTGVSSVVSLVVNTSGRLVLQHLDVLKDAAGLKVQKPVACSEATESVAADQHWCLCAVVDEEVAADPGCLTEVSALGLVGVASSVAERY